jgi:hypothetical protein
MGSEVLAFAQVAVIIVLLTGTLSAITVGLVRGLSMKPKPRGISETENQQILQLQQSIDAIAVEVERIAEAQRFSARLLAERQDPAIAAGSPRTNNADEIALKAQARQG